MIEVQDFFHGELKFIFQSKLSTWSFQAMKYFTLLRFWNICLGIILTTIQNVTIKLKPHSNYVSHETQT